MPDLMPLTTAFMNCDQSVRVSGNLAKKDWHRALMDAKLGIHLTNELLKILQGQFVSVRESTNIQRQFAK